MSVLYTLDQESVNHCGFSLDFHDLDPTTTIAMPKPELGFFNSNDVKGEEVFPNVVEQYVPYYSAESVPNS